MQKQFLQLNYIITLLQLFLHKVNKALIEVMHVPKYFAVWKCHCYPP